VNGPGPTDPFYPDGADGPRGPDGADDPSVDEADLAGATADLDDETGELVPDSAPLTLAVVESILDRRWPESRIEPTLDRISALLDLLGNPQDAYPVIHVAGTNGKTSVARMIDSLLTTMGLRTGRFTSPHLQLVTERISIDGAPVSADRYVDAYADISPYVDLVDAASAGSGGVAMSKFEVLTAMAFAVFADTPVEVAIVEVGLGGTWDSTNVVTPAVAVLTPIGLDHQDYLGTTLASVATNKAGIIKQGCTTVVGIQEPEAMTEVLRRAVEMDATVARQNSEFAVAAREFAIGGQRLTLQGLGGIYPEIFLPLSGAHQADNAALALAAVEAFFGAGVGKQLDTAAVEDGFAAVSSPGRLERVRTSPTILVDAAHNPHGAAALARALAEEFSFARLVGVLAVMADKDVDGILRALVDSFDDVVVTVNSSSRSMPVDALAAIADDVFGARRVHRAARMDEAIAMAVDLAESGADDVGAAAGVVITGSVVSAGDGRTLVGLGPS